MPLGNVRVKVELPGAGQGSQEPLGHLLHPPAGRDLLVQQCGEVALQVGHPRPPALAFQKRGKFIVRRRCVRQDLVDLLDDGCVVLDHGVVHIHLRGLPKPILVFSVLVFGHHSVGPDVGLQLSELFFHEHSVDDQLQTHGLLIRRCGEIGICKATQLFFRNFLCHNYTPFPRRARC